MQVNDTKEPPPPSKMFSISIYIPGADVTVTFLVHYCDNMEMLFEQTICRPVRHTTVLSKESEINHASGRQDINLILREGGLPLMASNCACLSYLQLKKYTFFLYVFIRFTCMVQREREKN